MDELIARALAAGFGVAVITAPLGCFVVWRRMAYFGDALSHAALLGVALGIIFGIDARVGLIALALGAAAALVFVRRRKMISEDTLLGVFAHTALSLGVVLLALQRTPSMDLMAFLFGDILAVGKADLLLIAGAGALILAGVGLLWRKLLAVAVHEELARVEGIDVTRVQLAFMLLLALVVSVAMKVVGALLVTSLLIIPAATARAFARGPEQMAFLAMLFGCTAVVLGIGASMQWDTPTGPSVVVAASAQFLASLGVRSRY